LGILQAAYRTYENHLEEVGVVKEGMEALAPVSHMFVNAHIEVTIREDGIFQSACAVAKQEAKTVIPVTIESAGRVGNNDKAHPLSDQLRYLATYGEAKFEAYRNNLERWVNSTYTHPKIRAILHYIQGESIVADLAAAEVIKINDNGQPGKGSIEGTAYDKCLIRWRIIPAPEGVKSACWEDIKLFECFTLYYREKLKDSTHDICQLTGVDDAICEMHPKGVVYANNGAKLISANDKSNFTYRGRFTKPGQVSNVGYTASQKAHHVLHWIAANSGVIIGGRTFLCWNPEGKEIPENAFWSLPSEDAKDFVSYKKQLLQTIGGYRNTLKDTDDVMIATLDAATTGRLSVTYYNELKASDFLDRLEDWYLSCCWETAFYGIKSPSLRQIVSCAFGTLQRNFIETDDKVMRDYMQRLMHCLIDKQSIPLNVVQALTTKAGNLQIYPPALREQVLITACAVIRKYRNERGKKEEWTLALNIQNPDRSYQFGRLLAVGEQVERSTFDRDEKRETNAIRMQAVFSQRPLYAWRILDEKLNPYFKRLNPGLRNYYRNIIAEIFEMLSNNDKSDLGKRLDDIYLMGYYHQRSALINKNKKNNVVEENENESIKEQD